MSAVDQLDPWMLPIIRRWIAEGHRRDELMSDLERMDRRGGRDWTLRDRRAIEAAFDELWREASMPAPSKGTPTREEVLAKQAELVAGGLPHGQKALARALHTSQATIRRRLSDK